MNNIIDIEIMLRERMLAARNFHRLASSQDFEKLFEGADGTAKDCAIHYIRNGDQKQLEAWMAAQEKVQMDLSTFSVRKLRDLAKTYGIPDYGWMPKASLLSALENFKRARNGHTN